jgi:cysteine desulfurase/selenocysteine lyase
MNTDKIRQDFPVLQKKITYLDSACMALKPVQVVEAMNRYFLEFPACGERSSHRLGRQVTEEFEAARKKIAQFINADPEETIFTKNTTEGLNLISNSLEIGKNDTVITSDKEHNSNFLPWRKFNHLIVKTKDGRFDLDSFQSMMNRSVKIVSLVQTSNIDGMSFPIKEIHKIVHDNGSLFVVDGAQSVPHRETDVRKLGCDVLAFSGHKMLGPSIGCIYIKKDVPVRPFMVGGGTVLDVRDGNPQYLKPPQMFEAGLQDYAGAIGLGAAVEYIKKTGLKEIERHETDINKAMTEGIKDVRNATILGGPPEERGGVLSFNIKGIDSREAAIMLDSYDVLVRGGYHCCHHWFNSHGIAGSVRASAYLYNNEQDAENFADAVRKIAALA